MSPSLPVIVRTLTAVLLTLLIAACSTPQPLVVPVDSRPVIPPLSAAASEPPPPSICSPTCLAGLTRLRETLRTTLTHSAPAYKPAGLNTGR